MDTLCAKCLPQHIDKIKEVVAYACKKRRDDVLDIQKQLDPDGSLREKFEQKFGKVDCD